MTKQDVRQRLLPNASNEDVSRALIEVYDLAATESARHSLWWHMPHTATSFVHEYPPADIGRGLPDY